MAVRAHSKCASSDTAAQPYILRRSVATPRFCAYCTKLETVMRKPIASAALPSEKPRISIGASPCVPKPPAVIAERSSGNVSYVLENGVGAYDEDPEAMARIVAGWFALDGEVLEEMSKKARMLGRPEATFNIVRDLAGMACGA